MMLHANDVVKEHNNMKIEYDTLNVPTAEDNIYDERIIRYLPLTTRNIKKTIEKKQCAEKGTLLFLLCDYKGTQVIHEKGKEK